jgi:hypothetical protein
MKKLLPVIAVFFIHVSSVAQTDSVLLKETVGKLDRALLEKDTALLKILLHTDVSFGHSNGWVETKKEVVNDLASGFLVYKSLTNDKTTMILNKNWASVRTTTKATGAREGKEFDLTLHVLQVWVKSKNGWKLIARQSTKLS